MDWRDFCEEGEVIDRRCDKWIAANNKAYVEEMVAYAKQQAERKVAMEKLEGAMDILKAVEENRKAKWKASEEEFHRRQAPFKDRLAKTRMKQVLLLVKRHNEKALQCQNVRPTVST
ncbi:hypothetical protein ACLB2K_066138 [Fragaria x ananassa]